MKRKFKYLTYTLLILMIFTLVACDTRGRPNDNTPDSPYEDQLQLSSWNELPGVNRSGLWLVYYYSPLCAPCMAIQDDVLGFANLFGEEHPIYFADATNGFSGNPPTTGIQGTPTMLVMNDSQFIELYTGSSAIINLLGAIQNDTYVLPLG
jgi:hypothetical protein